VSATVACGCRVEDELSVLECNRRSGRFRRDRGTASNLLPSKYLAPPGVTRRRSATRLADNGIRWGIDPDSCSTSVAEHVRKAKGRALMASRYLPRRSAGKKAVALTVLFVTGAASGVVTVAAAGTAVAASTTHAMATASPATAGGPQDHFGTSRPRISSGPHSPGDRPPAADADGYIRRNG